VPSLVETRVAKAPSLTQRSAQALAQLAEIVERSDTKLLAVALAEGAVNEAERNRGFARSLQLLYDALATSAKPPRAKPTAKPRKELTPIIAAGEVTLGRTDTPDAYLLQRVYGNDQLRDALDGYSLATLKAMAAEAMARNEGTRPSNMRSKESVLDYIVLHLTGSR
jgi:hypothetical protein